MTNMNLNTMQNTTQETQTSYKILVVEDDPIIRKIHRMFLEKLGYKVHTVETGMQALSELSESTYDAAIIDLGLPDVTGHYVSSAIRVKELSSKKHLPIIIVTAHGDEEARKECMAYGADVFFIKPVSMEKFKETLEKLLASKE